MTEDWFGLYQIVCLFLSNSNPSQSGVGFVPPLIQQEQEGEHEEQEPQNLPQGTLGLKLGT